MSISHSVRSGLPKLSIVTVWILVVLPLSAFADSPRDIFLGLGDSTTEVLTDAQSKPVIVHCASDHEFKMLLDLEDHDLWVALEKGIGECTMLTMGKSVNGAFVYSLWTGSGANDMETVSYGGITEPDDEDHFSTKEEAKTEILRRVRLYIRLGRCS